MASRLAIFSVEIWKKKLRSLNRQMYYIIRRYNRYNTNNSQNRIDRKKRHLASRHRCRFASWFGIVLTPAVTLNSITRNLKKGQATIKSSDSARANSRSSASPITMPTFQDESGFCCHLTVIRLLFFFCLNDTMIPRKLSRLGCRLSFTWCNMVPKEIITTGSLETY